MNGVFAMNKNLGLPLQTEDQVDDTSILTVISNDNPLALNTYELGTFALTKATGLPLKTIDAGDGTSLLVINSYDLFGNVFYVQSGKTFTINSNRENIVTSPMTVDGTLVIHGRNTIFG